MNNILINLFVSIYERQVETVYSGWREPVYIKERGIIH